MNPENLSESYQAKLKQILLRNRRLATAYRLKEDLRLIFKMNFIEVPAALEKWRRRAWSCRIPQCVNGDGTKVQKRQVVPLHSERAQSHLQIR